MSRRTQKNVGVIGLGIIGRRVADNLRRRGFHVFVWNRTPRPFPNFVGSPSELAELCDFVQIFVSDDEALLQMVQQMKPALTAEHVVMAHSTVAPHTMRNAAEIVQRRGAQFLDAPFTGSKIGAEKGELVYYVAGDDTAFRRARRVLEASSKEIIEIGEIGQATTVKLATNIVTVASIQSAAEALALVHNSGLAPEKFAAALRGNASNSGTLAMKLPKMIEGDFDAHFSVKHMLKDVQIAARMARSYGLALGATEAARDSLLEEANSGRADKDYSSLVHFFFPEGLPRKASPTPEEHDPQQKLNGLDEEAAAQVRRDERASAESDTREAEPVLAEPTEATADETDESEVPSGEKASVEAESELAEAAAADDEKYDGVAPASPVADEEKSAATSTEESDAGGTKADESEEANDDSEPAATAREPDQLAAADEQRESEAEPEGVAEAEEADATERATTPTSAPETRATPAGDYELGGEPPMERRANGDREAGRSETSEKDETAARRSFLSRMFGRGDDY